MKHFSKSLVVAALSSFSGVTLAAGAILVQAPIDKVFVPNGFDDNDKVEVIVHGHFNSSCYKMGPVSASIDAVTNKVNVTAEAYYYPNATCIQMMIPFTKTVEVNRHLNVGTYDVKIFGRPQLGSLPLRIAPSKGPDADDFIYASVNSANLEQNAAGDQEIVLKGQHPYLLQGCIKFDSIVSYVGADNVVVVQPITRIINSDDECLEQSQANKFDVRKKLDQKLIKGEYLMHVRALDGNSINQFVEIE